jgi:hypothetical protein
MVDTEHHIRPHIEKENETAENRQPRSLQSKKLLTSEPDDMIRLLFESRTVALETV